MHHVIGIDPGTEHSGAVCLECDDDQAPANAWRVVSANLPSNGMLLEWLESAQRVYSLVAIEQMEFMGQYAGAEMFKTIWWSGRFFQAASCNHSIEAVLQVPRSQVKLEVCGARNAKDGQIRQALIDRFPKNGIASANRKHAKCSIGTKRAPGPLHGVTGHCWQALAVAVTAIDCAKVTSDG